MAYEPPDFYEPTDFAEFDPYMPFPPSSPIVSHVQKQPLADTVKTALTAAAVLSFIVLISKDAHKAFTRRAHWIPCDFLVLSAFSIQLLTLLNAQSEALGSSSNASGSSSNMKLSIKADGTGSNGNGVTWQDFLSIHNSRTLLCVFAAYVMPAMADRGLEHSWVRWVALVITVFHHVTSEFYFTQGDSTFLNLLRLWPQENGPRDTRYYVFATIISLCFILLILLLACATIAGRSIERIVTQKISLVLTGEGEFSAGLAEQTREAHPHPHAHHHPHHHSCWRTVMIDLNTDDHPDHLHLHHDQGQDHDHSCWQSVKKALLKAENEHHSCWRTVEDAVLRAEKREENRRDSCWRTVEDVLLRGEEHHRRLCHYCWRTVEDAVLKAWIIVRAYSFQPVIARSALAASVAIIVTIQIVITVVGGLAKEVDVHQLAKNKTFKFVATVLQSLFILIAWLLINLRWATAVAYYRRPEKDSWRSGLRIEDFWTRHLKELKQARETRLPEAQSVDTGIEQLVSKEQVKIDVPSILLSAAIGVQLLLVSFSKACWLASLLIFHNKWMRKLFSYIFGKRIMFEFEDYPKYRKILEDVQMLGDSPESLWVTNRKAIEKAKNLIIQGSQDGEYNCEDLVDFLSNKKTVYALGLSCLDPYKPQTGLKFLCKKRPRPIQRTQQTQEGSDVEKQHSRGGKDPLAVEEHFTDVSTKSWKMTAVSLLSIIVHLSQIYADVDKEHCSTSHTFPPRTVKDCLGTYSQAWEIIDFVEEADTEADGITREADRITSEAADRYFQALQKKVAKGDFPANKFRHATPECARAALEELKRESESSLSRLVFAVNGKKEKGRKGNDSIDWKAAASGSAIYNLCDSIECNDGTDVGELLKELESSLADIINECVKKVQPLVLLNSSKWALNRDEKMMGKALYAAGKAKVIMQKLEGNELAIVSYH